MALRWWNAIALAAVLAVGWVADSLPLGGRSAGEISAMFPVLIMPAPYANAIWGLIYALLGCFVIYQLIPTKDKQLRADTTGPWFIVSCAFNAVWIVLWHFCSWNPASSSCSACSPHYSSSTSARDALPAGRRRNGSFNSPSACIWAG